LLIPGYPMGATEAADLKYIARDCPITSKPRDIYASLDAHSVALLLRWMAAATST